MKLPGTIQISALQVSAATGREVGVAGSEVGGSSSTVGETAVAFCKGTAVTAAAVLVGEVTISLEELGAPPAPVRLLANWHPMVTTRRVEQNRQKRRLLFLITRVSLHSGYWLAIFHHRRND
jgi:hypothetical protein